MGLRVLVAALPAPIPAPAKNPLTRIEVFGFHTWSTVAARGGIESYLFLTTFDLEKAKVLFIIRRENP